MREINRDFIELQKFISEYKVLNLEPGTEFNEALKRMHKRYFAFLALHHELLVEDGYTANLPKEQSEIFKFRIGEVLSELGTILFLSVHGCYKAAKLVMRSSIENFSKAVGCLVDIEIVNETSVYKVIETALSHNVFLKKAVLEKNYLYEKYSMLCEDVHTASIKNMQRIECVGNFPISDFQAFNFLADSFIKLINVLTAILIKIEPNIFHKAHHSRKDLISLILSNEDKRLIHQL
ncbi:hypothetical protein ACMGGX_10245 [Enterobacter sp. BNK-29]